MTKIKNKVIIIAEAGVNHNGDTQIAKKLVKAAKFAGADYVKFQTFKADKLVTETAKLANYQKKKFKNINNQYKLIRKLELSKKQHEIIYKYCKKIKIGFLSSGFDIESIDYLYQKKLDYIKIPSGEINNFVFLRHIGKKNKRVLLSSGMSFMYEIIEAIKVLVKYGTNKKNITILQCNTEYPSPYKDINLNAMISIKNKTGCNVGISDHSNGIEVPIAAVALGAKVVEKHFTIDTKMIGPDHAASLEPGDFKKMVDGIRNIELALGSSKKKPSESEKKNIKIVRRSIVAKSNIKKGEKFSIENITVKRPGYGLSPMLWKKILGKVSKKNFKKDDFIKLNQN